MRILMAEDELSTARATELVGVLVIGHRFAPERLSVAGYAEYHPIATNLKAQGTGAESPR
jgi:flagellar motor protein MotB